MVSLVLKQDKTPCLFREGLKYDRPPTPPSDSRGLEGDAPLSSDLRRGATPGPPRAKQSRTTRHKGLRPPPTSFLGPYSPRPIFVSPYPRTRFPGKRKEDGKGSGSGPKHEGGGGVDGLELFPGVKRVIKRTQEKRRYTLVWTPIFLETRTSSRLTKPRSGTANLGVHLNFFPSSGLTKRRLFTRITMDGKGEGS